MEAPTVKTPCFLKSTAGHWSMNLMTAVMVEDVARTLAYATMIGDISSLPQSEIDANHDRYINRYGTATASTGVTS